MDTARHGIAINDVNRAWVETRRYGTDGPSFDVYVALCDCGHRFDGTDGGDVARQFAAHVKEQEG